MYLALLLAVNSNSYQIAYNAGNCCRHPLKELESIAVALLNCKLLEWIVLRKAFATFIPSSTLMPPHHLNANMPHEEQKRPKGNMSKTKIAKSECPLLKESLSLIREFIKEDAKTVCFCRRQRQSYNFSVRAHLKCNPMSHSHLQILQNQPHMCCVLLLLFERAWVKLYTIENLIEAKDQCCRIFLIRMPDCGRYAVDN